MSTAHDRTRQQQKVEDLCAAIIRALSGEADVHYRGQRLHKGQRQFPVHAPHLQPDPEQDDFSSFRGTADSIALRLQYTDPVLHRQFCPTDPVERLVFELLEQLRVETMVPQTMPGMTQNLHHRFSAWSHAFHQSGLTDSASGILLYTVFQICWSRLTGQPVLEKTEDLIESTRAAIAPMLGKDLLGIRRNCGDQSAYARHARSIAGIVGEMIRSADTEQGDNQKSSEGDDAKSAFRLLLHFDSDESDTIAVAATGQSKVLDDAEHGYAVFSTQYDRQAEAGSLVRKALLREYRDRIDHRISELGINIPRLARRLMILLAVPQRDGWSFGEEDGYIDGRRLAQLITSPAERRLFRQEQHKPDADCLVSFLVDCSGSMKTHAESITILIDVMVRALEQAGVSSEVLGFTTGAWNGGRVQRDWMRARSPKNPGRLNELLHMVFKSADQTWRRARPDITALLKADLYREGIDGEAVDWACRRLQLRNEKRRILVVISDGCPMDSATNLANDEFYLANHLKQVVARQEHRGEVEICGLGVGLDLSTYYSRSLATDLPHSLNNALLLEIAQLIGARGRQ
ncbi:cobalt chelatase [Undibacterium arcticum]|uniref:Cobalt chelatase n=1 Tax=Undibacterium arcticum TaxID=1762892 RepID=A0ABV7EXV5_9BURK